MFLRVCNCSHPSLLKIIIITPFSVQIYRAAAKLVTIGLSDPQSPVNISPKTIKVFTALANLLREHTTDYQEAYEMTRKAVQQEPEWEESHNMMGNCLMKLERHSEAKLAFKRSVCGHSAWKLLDLRK